MTNVASFLVPVTLGSALFWATPSVVTQDPGDTLPQEQATATDRWLANVASSFLNTAVVAESAQDDIARDLPTLDRAFGAQQAQDTALVTAGANEAEVALRLIQDQMAQSEQDVTATTTDITSLRAQLEQLRHELKNQPDGPRSTDLADRVLSLRDEIASLEVALVDQQTWLAALQTQYQHAAAGVDQSRAALEYLRVQDLVERQHLLDLLAAQVITQAQDPAPAAEATNGRLYETYLATRYRADLEGMIAQIEGYEAAIRALSDVGATEAAEDLQRQRDTMRDQVHAIQSMGRYDTAAPDDAQLIDLVMSLRNDVQALRDEVRGLREAIEQTRAYPGTSNRTPRHPGAGR